jgi:hypothetical protein
VGFIRVASQTKRRTDGPETNSPPSAVKRFVVCAGEVEAVYHYLKRNRPLHLLEQNMKEN